MADTNMRKIGRVEAEFVGATSSDGSDVGAVALLEGDASVKASFQKEEVTPNYYVSSDVSTITTGNDIDIVGDASNKFLRVGINGGLLVPIAQQILSGRPNVIPLGIDESVTFKIEVPSINTVALAIVNSAATPPAGCLNPAATTVTDLLDGTGTESFWVFDFTGLGVITAEIAFLKQGTNGGSFNVRGFK